MIEAGTRRWSLGSLASPGCSRAIGSLALGLAAGVLTATAGVVARSTLRRRRAIRELAELIAAVRTLVVELQAGSRPADALRAAAERAPAQAATLGGAADRAAVGSDVSGALGRGAPGLMALGHAWRVAETAGAPVADVLARVASDLEDGRRRAQAVSSALAGSRSSAACWRSFPWSGCCSGRPWVLTRSGC